METHTNVPVAAGLASSASGFAALVLALDELMGWGLGRKDLSILARMGSGSASRSLYEGFVEWHAGEREDGMDSYAEPLDTAWPDLRIGLVLLSEGEKPVGSREAMNRTVETSALYASWPDLVARDIGRIKPALMRQDLHAMGSIAESNALSMHATMIGAWPPVVYWTPESLRTMHEVWQLRADGLPLYFTMDAGPNVKLIYEAGSQDRVQEAFPGLISVQPFGG